MDERGRGQIGIIAAHLEGISRQVADIVKHLDRVDGRLDGMEDMLRDQLRSHAQAVNGLIEAAKDTMLAEVKAVDAKIDFPVWGIRLIVGAIVLACLAAGGQVIFQVGRESQRTHTLPTTPFKEPPR